MVHPSMRDDTALEKQTFLARHQRTDFIFPGEVVETPLCSLVEFHRDHG